VVSFEDFKAMYERRGFPPEQMMEEYKKYQTSGGKYSFSGVKPKVSSTVAPTPVPPSAKQKASEAAAKIKAKEAISAPMRETPKSKFRTLDEVLGTYGKTQDTPPLSDKPFGGAFDTPPVEKKPAPATGLEKYSLDVPAPEEANNPLDVPAPEEANKPLEVLPPNPPAPEEAPLDPTTLDFGEDKDEVDALPLTEEPYVNKGREETSSKSSVGTEYLPEDVAAVRSSSARANEEGRSAFDRYKSLAEKEDEFDVSKERKDVIDEYTKGMEGADRVRFINAIMENLGKITSGAVGLKTGGNVASNYSYKALDPEALSSAAKDKYDIKGKDISSRLADNRYKSEQDLARAQGLYNASTDVNKAEMGRATTLADMNSKKVSDSKQEVNKLLSGEQVSEERRQQAQKELQDALELQGKLRGVGAWSGFRRGLPGETPTLPPVDKNANVARENEKSLPVQAKQKYMQEGNSAYSTIASGIPGITGIPAYAEAVNKAIQTKDPKDFDAAYGQLTTVISKSIRQNINNPEVKKMLEDTLIVLTRLKSIGMLVPEALKADASGAQKLYDLNAEWINNDAASGSTSSDKESVGYKGKVPLPSSSTPSAPPAAPTSAPTVKPVAPVVKPTETAAKLVPVELYEKAKRLLASSKDPKVIASAKSLIRDYEAQTKK
jgi:hypothetical protein